VNAEELDLALEELENRLERLRALYEQYFLGFEKIEPAVARKDVDRRIYVMRREKIRNTGKRFKLQTLIQRYNTFQQYWQRICREIENGTYKRHVLRAERQLSKEQQLTIATKRRFGKSLPPPALEAAAAADAASSFPPAGDEPPTDVIPRVPRAPSAGFEDQEPATAAFRKPVPITAAPPQPKPSPRPSKYESLDLDMGFLGSWAPPPAPVPVSAPSRAKAEPEPVAPRRETPPPKPRSAPRAAPAPEEPRPVRAQPPPKPARAAPPPAAASGGLSDDRVKELHARFVQAKRDNKEGGQVSLEGLAKTLRETESKLRAQYKNRKIDFEIVVKDGKTIVKPKVR
jgi:hypothetical protein